MISSVNLVTLIGGNLSRAVVQGSQLPNKHSGVEQVPNNMED